MKTKVCTGPAHAEPKQLPLTEEYWYFHKSGPRKGQVLTRCRQCQNWNKLIVQGGPHGLVPAEQLRPYAIELVERCGSIWQARRRYGFAEDTLRQLINGQHLKVQKRTAQRLLVAVGEQRKHDRKNGGSSERWHAARRAEGQKVDRLERLERTAELKGLR